ncbi:hypothetical protein LDENG_00269040 [Lucifuga dentata]|nr:hypothetical protein LDENG_00269040 [Lucifuga dentata]
MISIAKATEDSKYPSKHEDNAMAKRLVEYYDKRQVIKQSVVEHATAVFRALPLPSSTMPPRKLGTSSKALFHVLTTSEDPDAFQHQRPLSCPVVLVSEENCLIAIGSTPLATFDREDFYQGLLYLMGYYYVLHLTYPKSIWTLLSVLQTDSPRLHL